MQRSRLRWFGHTKKRDNDDVGKKILRLELPGKRPRGSPKRRFMDVIKEDMRVIGVRGDGVRWGG